MDNDDGYQPQGQDYPYPYSIPQPSAYDYQDFSNEGQVVFHDLDKKKNVVKSSNPAPTFYSIPQTPSKVRHGKFFRPPPHPYHGPQAHLHQHTGQTIQGPIQDPVPKKAKRERRKKKRSNESSDQLVPCTNTNTEYLQVQPGMIHHGNRLEDTSEKRNHESSSTVRESSPKSTSEVISTTPSLSEERTGAHENNYPTPATPASLHDHPPNSIMNMRLDSIYYRTMDVENIREEDIDLNLLEGDDLELDDSMEKGQEEPKGPIQNAPIPPKSSEIASSTQDDCASSGQYTNTPSPASIHDHGDHNDNSFVPATPASLHDHPPNSILNMRLDSIYYRTMDVENIGEEDIDLNLFEGDDLDLEAMDTEEKSPKAPQGDRSVRATKTTSHSSAKTTQKPPSFPKLNKEPIHNSSTPSPATIHIHDQPIDMPASIPDHPPNSILNMRLDSIYYRTMDVENIGEEDIDLNLLEGDNLDLEAMDTEEKDQSAAAPSKRITQNPKVNPHFPATTKRPVPKESEVTTSNQETSNLLQNSSTPSPASLHDHPPNSIMNMRLDSIYYRTMDVENINEEDIDLNLLEGDDIDLEDLSAGDKEPQGKIIRNVNIETGSSAATPTKTTRKPIEKQPDLGAPPTPAGVHDHPPNSIINMRLDSVYFRTMDVENIGEEDIDLNLLEGDDIDLDAMDTEKGNAPGSSESPVITEISKLPQNPVQATTNEFTQKESEPLLNSNAPSPASKPEPNASNKNSNPLLNKNVSSPAGSHSDAQKIPEHPPNSILNMRLDSIYYRTMDVENIREEDINLNLLMGDDDIDLDVIDNNQKDDPRDKNVGQLQGKSTQQTLETRGRNMEYLDLDTMKTIGTQSFQSFPPTPQPAILPDHPPNSIMNLRLDSVYYRTMDVENIDVEDINVDILEKDDLNLEEMDSEESEPDDPKSLNKQPSPLRHRQKNSTSPTSNITSSSDEGESDSEGDYESSEDEEEDVVVSIRKKAPNRNKSRIISGNCSNCSVKESTYWRKNKNGEQVCNPCALYEKNTGVKRPESLWKKEINRREGIMVKENQKRKKENKEKRKRPCIICEKSCHTVRNPPLCFPCRKGTANTAMECSICGEGGKKLATHYFVKGKAQCYQCYEKKIDRKSNAGKARIAVEKEKARKEAEAKAKEIEHIFAIPQLPSDKPRCHKCAASDVKLVTTNVFEGSPPTCRKCYLAAWREKKRSEKPVVAKPKECHKCVKCGATGVKMEKCDPVTKARTCKKCYSREWHLRNKEKRMNEGR